MPLIVSVVHYPHANDFNPFFRFLLQRDVLIQYDPMISYHQIRANYDRESIVVYQAYRDAIGKAALANGRFVEPFSWGRMTWIKPSFLWMMARCNWAQKSGQENVLAIRIKRSGWDKALSMGFLTSFHPKIHQHDSQWRDGFDQAKVHVQWDPERTIHGKKLEHRSIQVGLSRHIIRQFTDEWILEISDFTPQVKKIRTLYLAGHLSRAKEQLPRERIYPVTTPATAANLGIQVD